MCAVRQDTTYHILMTVIKAVVGSGVQVPLFPAHIFCRTWVLQVSPILGIPAITASLAGKRGKNV